MTDLAAAVDAALRQSNMVDLLLRHSNSLLVYDPDYDGFLAALKRVGDANMLPQQVTVFFHLPVLAIFMSPLSILTLAVDAPRWCSVAVYVMPASV